MRTKIMAIVGSTLVVVLALSGVAWAAASPPLAVTNKVPTGGATEIAPSADILAYFNHDMKASTITSTTFVIREQHTTTGLGATRSVNNNISPTSANDGSESVVTLNPNENLASNTTYEVLIVGGRSGVKDVKNKTLGSNVSWTFKTGTDITPPDTTPPDTTINTKPTDPSNSASPSFTFSGTDNVTPPANLTFECKLDNEASFTACTSPKALSNLAEGSHTFSVKAKDAAGLVDDTPASYTWTVDTTVDTTAPDTTITDQPANPTNSTSASFTFSGSDNVTPAGSLTFECKLDNEASFTACTSPKALSNLAEGSHTFSVKAKDAAGLVDATPASYTWTVNTVTTAPKVESVSPADSTPDVARGTNVVATFTERVDPVSITRSTFTLGQCSSAADNNCGAQITDVVVSLSTDRLSATLNPGTLLAASTKYKATITTGVTDEAGNALAQQKVWYFTTGLNILPPSDTTPPDTTINTKPADPSNNASASFTFSGTDDVTPAGSLTFECKLDAGSFAACTSPKALSNLAEGSHTFSVRAKDAALNVDTTPASYTWTVNTVTTPPDTTINTKPADPSNNASASFTFSGTDDVTPAGSLTFECKLDAGSFAACTSPKALSNLANGSHTFCVRAKDAAGLVDATPACYTWTVDTAAPDTTITDQPANPTNSNSATFEFTSTEANSTFETNLDNQGWLPTDSNGTATSKTYSSLSDGSHTFQVRAKDAAGNVDATPDSYTWTVDAVSGVTVTPSPLDFTPGSSLCSGTITKTVTIANNTASQVDLFPSVTNAHYSVASDELHIASGESLPLSVSWTAPGGFKFTDSGRLELKDAGGNTVATGDLTAFQFCPIEG